MAKSLYMHTLNNNPAYFEDRDNVGGGQIVYANKFTPIARLETSLAAIKRNIKKTEKFRRGCGWDFDPSKYSYVRIQQSALEGAD